MVRSLRLGFCRVGVVNLLFTLLSVYFVDRLGRRKLYFLGLSGIVISLSLLATSFIFRRSIRGFREMAFHCPYFLICGIFRYQHRASRLVDCVGSVSTKVKRAGGFSRFIVRLVFQCDRIVYLFQDTEGILNTGNRFNDQWRKQGNPAGAFLFYAFIGIVAIIWGYFYVPETKGVSLENIEAFWRKGGHPKDKII